MIIAVDADGGIGLKNELPWYCPEDFAHFKEMTEGSTVVMGMNTYKSLPMYPKGLPKRSNLVICRNPEECTDSITGVTFVTLDQVRESEISGWVIGGAHTVHELKDQILVAAITRMPGTYGCDVFIDTDDFTDEMEFLERKELTSDVHVDLYAGLDIIPDLRKLLK